MAPWRGDGPFLYTSVSSGGYRTYCHRLIPGAGFRRSFLGPRAFGFYRSGFAFGVDFGRLAVLVASFLRFLVSRLVLGPPAVVVVACGCLVVRVRHTATALLN